MQTVFGFAFKPRRPRRGWFLVCMRRRKVYGVVGTVRRDKTFKRIGDQGVVIDSRKSGVTWESIQLDESGEFRFVEEVPPGFTAEGTVEEAPPRIRAQEVLRLGRAVNRG